MNILIAPDKFKGSLSANQVCHAIANGLRTLNVDQEIITHPLADGGDGSLDILNHHLDLQKVELQVSDPLGKKINTYYYKKEQEAYIEVAKASGLVLINQEAQNPLYTSTYGTGEMVRHAIENKSTKINLFLGGSATNDGGLGIAAALGYVFRDKNKSPVEPIGNNLGLINTIDDRQAVETGHVKFSLISDVQNPLLGPNGAAYVYAPQKGAAPDEVKKLDQGLAHIAAIIYAHTQINIQSIPGSGAAGGIPAAMVGLFNATIHSGIKAMMSWTNFESILKSADMVISGEGKLDDQSLQGKVIHGVAELCKKYNKPLYLFVGKNELENDKQLELNAKGIYEIMSVAKNEKDAITNGVAYLKELVVSNWPVE